MDPSGEDMISWGANFKPNVMGGQWWRLITSVFLHIGVMHLLVNMYALMFIGVLLENQIGYGRYLMAYLLCGILGSVGSLWWNDLVISAGASGAIFGLFGLYLSLLLTGRIFRETRKSFMTSAILFIGYNLLAGFQGGIDNAAHIGGLMGGFVIGIIYYPSLKNVDNQIIARSTYLATPILILAISYLLLSQVGYNFNIYEDRMDLFTRQEELALGIYQMDENSSRDENVE